ncbi:Stk17b [Symbiodinium natans]|uniref:Stk17b protein n=1 Tax=Symbiodinium natans TaxID=878477 RepID=A0A812MSZ4_9DINO|nr:Stk17b [Symbiodinium natans]
MRRSQHCRGVFAHEARGCLHKLPIMPSCAKEPELQGHCLAANLPGLHLFTLQEKCDRSLKDFLGSHSASEPQIAFIVSSIMQGLAHIHQQHVFHRDITDGNILLADCGRRVVICDFDLSVQTSGASEVVWRCGTPGFVAPEIFIKRRGTARSDVFSVGAIAFFAACGKHAFMRETYKATCHATINEEPDFWGGQVLQRSPACLSLIDNMLCKQGFLRPSAAEALMSDWLDQTEKQDLSKALLRTQKLVNVRGWCKRNLGCFNLRYAGQTSAE